MRAIPSARALSLPVVALLLATSWVVACAGDDQPEVGLADPGGQASTSAPTTTSGGPGPSPAGVEEFRGPLDAFYVAPDPLPPGDPGDLIRTMPLEAPEGQAGLRIMYHSTDAEGDDRAATGVIYHPTDEAPADGWPILAWAHGTSGLATQCAPSREPVVPPDLGVEGVRVAADYIGLGPVGEVHPYLSAAAEGHAVIDAVTAARSLPEVHGGDRWVVAGHSQGGHAALVTQEMAADRLPEVELVGTVAVAPGAQLAETYGDEIQVGIIEAMVLFGAAYEDPSIELDDYLTPEAQAALGGVAEEGCLDDIIGSLLPIVGGEDFWVSDPRTGPLGDAWIEANDPGQVAGEAPLLLVQGGRDIIVLPARTDALFGRLCALGQSVEMIDLPEADHGTEVGGAMEEMSAWVAARFADEPATDDC